MGHLHLSTVKILLPGWIDPTVIQELLVFDLTFWQEKGLIFPFGAGDSVTAFGMLSL